MTNLGSDLIESMKDAVAHAEGSNVEVRETTIEVPTEVDVRAIRGRLGLSQAGFAVRFGFSVGAVRHWEQGRRLPEGPVRAYLKVIDKIPEEVQTALVG